MPESDSKAGAAALFFFFVCSLFGLELSTQRDCWWLAVVGLKELR